jgi:hypothetical protein
VSLLKFVKKIGVCIGGSDSRNSPTFAIHTFFNCFLSVQLSQYFVLIFSCSTNYRCFFLFCFITRPPVLLQLFFCPKFCMEKGVNYTYTPIKDVFHQLENRHTHLQLTRFSLSQVLERTKKSKTQEDTVHAIGTVQRTHSWT